MVLESVESGLEESDGLDGELDGEEWDSGPGREAFALAVLEDDVVHVTCPPCRRRRS